MTEHEPFISAIETHPDDDTTRLVYADWLDDRADPRGEYLRAELRAAADPQGSDTAAARRRMRELRPGIDPAWLARFDQPRVLRANPTPYPAEWYCVRLRGYRDTPSTYGRIDYADLPPLRGPAFTGEFGWLPERGSLPPPSPEHRDRQSRFAAHLARLEAHLGDLGMTLPPGFTRWLTDRSLYARIPSCTDCEVLWPWNAAATADGDGGRLLSFYVDSQGCLTWHLYLTPGGYHAVVCGGDACDPWWWVDKNNPSAPLEAPPRPGREAVGEDDADAEDGDDGGMRFVAPSFEAFLHRWWLENTIWYKLASPEMDFHDPAPLTDEERAYLDYYRTQPVPGPADPT